MEPPPCGHQECYEQMLAYHLEDSDDNHKAAEPVGLFAYVCSSVSSVQHL